MIKRLSQCVREYKKDALLSPLYVLVESFLDVAIPFVMADLIDKGIEAGNMPMILRYGALLVGFALVALAFGALAGRSCARATAGLARNLRHDMFHHLQVYSFSNIDKFSSAGLVTRLTTDVSNVQNAFMMIVRTLIRCPAMLIFAMVMSFRINHDISLVFLAVIPVLGVGLYLIIRRVYPVFERVFKTYDRLNGVVQENLSGIRVVKNFVREDHEIQKFDAISGTIYKDFSLAERILALNSPLMQGCVYVCMILVSWLGAKQIVIGTMSTGNLMSFFTYIMQILSSLMMLSMVFVMITMSRASAERIVEVLEQKGQGLNLTWEVRNGILNHRTSGHPATLEGNVVRLSDKIAYINHDIDDAIRGKIMKEEDLPREYTDILGNSVHERLNIMIHDIIEHSQDKPEVAMSPEREEAMHGLRRWMFDHVYHDGIAKAEEGRAQQMIEMLYGYYMAHPEELPEESHRIMEMRNETKERAVCDYIAGMTDIYAIDRFKELFIPKAWSV